LLNLHNARPGFRHDTASSHYADAALTARPRQQSAAKPTILVAGGNAHQQCARPETGVFTWDDPVRIAQSLKRSAETSTRRKGTPLQSAMSMLNFYINRAGRGLPEKRRQILERAKVELRRAFEGA